MIRDLIVERRTLDPVRPALGTRGAKEDVCPADCCLMGAVRPVVAAAAQLSDSARAASTNERSAGSN
jgi:hypothetical protein